MKRTSKLFYVRDIDLLSDDQLKQEGFYKGMICPHNHTIRSLEDHSCYHCVRKIQSNLCGMNINFLSAPYKHKVRDLFNDIQIGELDECWESNRAAGRIRIASYRSTPERPTDNVTAAKTIYNATWGDVGKVTVVRSCKNKRCLNPLHLYSNYNVFYLPQEIHPFVLDFDPNELCQYMVLKKEGLLEQHFKKQYRETINHPLAMNDITEDNLDKFG